MIDVVYKWLGRYDRTLAGFEDKSHRPHRSPKAHTSEVIRLIRRLLKKYNWTDPEVYQELIQKYVYKRSYGGFKRMLSKLREIKPKKRNVNQSYIRVKCQGIMEKCN